MSIRDETSAQLSERLERGWIMIEATKDESQREQLTDTWIKVLRTYERNFLAEQQVQDATERAQAAQTSAASVLRARLRASD